MDQGLRRSQYRRPRCRCHVRRLAQEACALGERTTSFRADTQNVPCTMTALINDTTGTLVASNYVDPHTKIAVIFGTGCNAAYMESSENIPKMASVGLPSGTGMAINVSCMPLIRAKADV